MHYFLKSVIAKLIGWYKTTGKIQRILLVFGVVVVTYLVRSGLSPVGYVRSIEKSMHKDSVFLSGYDSVYSHPELTLLLKENTYCKSLLELSESEFIQPVLNLADSTLMLQIKGVTIHKAKISSYKTSYILRHLHNDIYLYLFSSPAKITEQRSTIVKEPVVVREAPKNPEQAALNAYQPDTLLQNPAFLLLTLSNGVYIIMEQSENVRFKDFASRLFFRSSIYIRNTFDRLTGFIMFKKVPFHPTIVIKTGADDLRSIYRAIPQEPLIVLRF